MNAFVIFAPFFFGCAFYAYKYLSLILEGRAVWLGFADVPMRAWFAVAALNAFFAFGLGQYDAFADIGILLLVTMFPFMTNEVSSPRTHLWQ